MIERFILNIFILLFLHALADFTFQTNTMANGKNKKTALNNWLKLGRDKEDFDKYVWLYWMTAHALIQGGLIGFMFGNWYIAIIEFVMHWIIDFLKTNNYTNIHHDQGMHLGLRIIYAGVLLI